MHAEHDIHEPARGGFYDGESDAEWSADFLRGQFIWGIAQWRRQWGNWNGIRGAVAYAGTRYHAGEHGRCQWSDAAWRAGFVWCRRILWDCTGGWRTRGGIGI